MKLNDVIYDMCKKMLSYTIEADVWAKVWRASFDSHELAPG